MTKDHVINLLFMALAEEKRLRELGQSPEVGTVQWESLRDVRRASVAETERAITAYNVLCGQPAYVNKPLVQEVMALARKYRHCPGDLLDSSYRPLEEAVYKLVTYVPPIEEADDDN